MSDGRLRDSRLFDIEAAYRRIRVVLGDFAHTVDLAGFDEFPGSLLTDLSGSPSVLPTPECGGAAMMPASTARCGGIRRVPRW